jgi:very-short-patch-repair endonuclease
MTPKTQTRPRVWRDRERRLARLTARQHGVVARRQLLALGFGEEAIKLRLDAGRLHHVHAAVFALGHSRIDQTGRRWAAVLAYGDGTLLSHRSAAALWGLSRQRSQLIDVTAATGRQGVRRREGIFVHRGRLHPEDLAVCGGLPVTAIARTLFDLAEFASLERLESVWEEADRLNLLSLRDVEDVCERGYGRHALRPIRRLLAEARATETTRSPLEDTFASFCLQHRLSAPVFNTTVLGYEIDALWPRQKIAVELDSWSFHHHRAAFERDRTRDAALQVAGYRTLRITHRRLHNEPATILKQLRALLGSKSASLEPKSHSG